MSWCSRMFGFDKATEEERLVRRDPMNMSAQQMRDSFFHPDKYLPRPGAERRILEILVELGRENSDLRQRVRALEDEIHYLKKDIRDKVGE